MKCSVVIRSIFTISHEFIECKWLYLRLKSMSIFLVFNNVVRFAENHNCAIHSNTVNVVASTRIYIHVHKDLLKKHSCFTLDSFLRSQRVFYPFTFVSTLNCFHVKGSLSLKISTSTLLVSNHYRLWMIVKSSETTCKFHKRTSHILIKMRGCIGWCRSVLVQKKVGPLLGYMGRYSYTYCSSSAENQRCVLI